MSDAREVIVRTAELGDAPAMGRAHVEAWQGAYRGIMPDAFLDALDADERATTWHDVIERNPNPDEGRRLVVDLDGQTVGLALVWPARGDDEKAVGELILINLVPSSWGTGAGTTLLHECVRSLATLGFDEAVLWVARDNGRARRFYEREGWSSDGAARADDVGGAVVEEVRYRIRLGTVID